jgi:hypothetical protein
MHLYLKYQNPKSLSSKNTGKFKFLITGQSSRSRSQCQKSWYEKKGLFMMHHHLKYKGSKALGSKILSRLKFFKTRSKFKITRSNVLIPKEMSVHEISLCEISEFYLPWFKKYCPG